MVVPQLPYTCETLQRNWKQKPTIYFFTKNRLGVKLSDVLQGKFEGINGRDTFPLDAGSRGITIRIHVSS